MTDAITIIAPRGIGDTVVSLPACYEYVRRGMRVNLLNAGTANWVEHLPTQHRIGTKCEGDIIDVGQGFEFSGTLRMLAYVSLRLGVHPIAIPQGPWLERRPEHAQIVERFGLPDDYIAVCPRGSSNNRAFCLEQVQALAELWPVAVLHNMPGEYPGNNLAGQTTVQEMVAIVAQARACVSVDTGTLHIAGALGVPLLGVVGSTMNPYAFCDDYRPSRWLKVVDPWTIAPQEITNELAKLLDETTEGTQ